LLEVAPDLKRVGSVWEGQLHIDGQRVAINEGTAITIKPNNTQKKAVKETAKVAKKRGQGPKDSESENEQPGVALNRIDQIRGNTFVSYEGVRQKDGTILAKKVEFAENELTSGEARLWKRLSPKVKEPSLTGGKPGELSIQQVGKFKLVPNAEVQTYVQQLGMSLIPKFQRDMPLSDPQKIHFQFFVVDQKVPNASALPNGTVIVNSGIITMLENEAQLAAVLSHEISHATEEHTYRQSQYHKKLRVAIAIGGAVGAAYGGRAVADLANLTEAAIRNGYQRSLENQADRVGMEYMVNAGYDPREAPRVWKVMAMKLGDHPTNFFWSDHDNDTTRRSYLMAELKNNYTDADFVSYKRNTDQFPVTVAALNVQYAPKARGKAR
jgi:peptidase M48-like protein